MICGDTTAGGYVCSAECREKLIEKLSARFVELFKNHSYEEATKIMSEEFQMSPYYIRSIIPKEVKRIMTVENKYSRPLIHLPRAWTLLFFRNPGKYKVTLVIEKDGVKIKVHDGAAEEKR